ncbi:MAG: glycosyltransferase family 39 protein [Anaerolineae bacterium]|jgi:hypothetical protein|nr:glycosyltransferase family 39 protein [Anaerolineae bacterium]MDH7474141.1 glycosyltransferase family 39 protein [Anaerolineae bacterium]
MNSRHWPRLALYAILLLAFALRLYHLDFQSLWSDEGISLLRSQQALGPMLADMPVEHAPLYFVLLHGWMRLTGQSDFALRFLSLLFSVLTVSLGYALGRDLFSDRIGLLTAILLAINPFQIWYAQEARMYSLVVCLTLASTWLLVRGWRGGGWAVWAGYALTTALALYTHYYAVLIPAFHAVFILGHRTGWQPVPLPRWLAAATAAALLFLPWLPRALRLLSFPGWREPVPLYTVPGRFLTAYSLGLAVPSDLGLWLAVGFLPILIAGLIVTREDSRPATAYAILYLAVPALIMALLLLRKPDFHERYLIVVTPAYALLLARGLNNLRRRAWPLSVVALLFILGSSAYALHNYYWDSRYHKPDFRGAARHLTIFGQAGDGILVDGPDPRLVFLHYYHGSLPVYDLRSLDQGDPTAIQSTLAPLAAQHGRLWTLLYFHPPGAIEAWLDAHGYLATTDDFNGIQLYLHATPPAATVMPTARLDIPLGQSARLTGYALEPTSLPADEILRLTLWAEVDGEPPAGYNVALRLVDATGFPCYAADRLLALYHNGEGWTAHYGLLPAPGTPPGPYTARLTVYGTDTEPVQLELGKVSVTPPAAPPSVEALEIAHPLEVAFGEELELLGYDAAPEIRTGYATALTLFWRARHPIASDYRLRLRLVDGDGRTWAAAELPPAGESHPTSEWTSGEVLRGQYGVIVDAAAPAGKMAWQINLIETESGRPLLDHDLTLSHVRVVAPVRRFSVPGNIQHPQRATLGNVVAFHGYDLDRTAVRAGETLHLILYWQALAPMDTSYTVFVHLLDAGGQIRGQRDSVPVAGSRPTTSWVQNEVIVDEYDIQVDADAPPGHYQIEIGMYDPRTVVRLPVFDADGVRLPEDRILLVQMEVK